jgi:hypothetical protein
MEVWLQSWARVNEKCAKSRAGQGNSVTKEEHAGAFNHKERRMAAKNAKKSKETRNHKRELDGLRNVKQIPPEYEKASLCDLCGASLLAKKRRN